MPEELHTMKKDIKKKIGLVVLFLLFVSAGAYYLVFNLGLFRSEPPETESVFSPLASGTAPTRTEVPSDGTLISENEVVIDNTGDTSFLPEYQRIYSSVTDYWADWSWENKVIEGRIRGINAEENELTILVTRPKGQTFSETVLRVLLNCPEEETYQLSGSDPTGDFTDQGFDIFANASEGDVIHAFCMDEACLNLGNACFLTKLAE